MKGIVLALLGFFAAAAMSLGGPADFALESTAAFNRDPADALRVPVLQRQTIGQWKTDAQSERRGSRPIVACTIFRLESRYADLAVQPVLGRINGAQLYLNF